MAGKDCDDLLQELGDLIHGELPPERARALKAHLDDCPPCFESADFQAQFKAMLAKRCSEEVPADFKSRLLGLLEQQG